MIIGFRLPLKRNVVSNPHSYFYALTQNDDPKRFKGKFFVIGWEKLTGHLAIFYLLLTVIGI
jgi:hypothetical protein